jgi:hypothetical protein
MAPCPEGSGFSQTAPACLESLFLTMADHVEAHVACPIVEPAAQVVRIEHRHIVDRAGRFAAPECLDIGRCTQEEHPESTPR